MTRGNSELDRLRSGRTELENHYIDELVSGNLSRRDFLRRGSVIGMSAPLLGAILAACGVLVDSSTSPRRDREHVGGARDQGRDAPDRVGRPRPRPINPLTISDAGGLCMLNQTGEFLVFDSNLKLPLEPMLALSWSPNADGSVWTFKLRPGVKFSNGRGDDRRPTSSTRSSSCRTRRTPPTRCRRSPACSMPSGVKAVDPMTVAVHARGAERELPLPRLLGQLQRDHRPQGHRLRHVAEHVHRHRRVQAGELHAERRRDVRAQPQLLGHEAAAVDDPLQVLLEPDADDPGAPGQRRRRDRAVHAGRRGGDPQQLLVQDHQAQVGQPPRAVDAQRHRAVHRRARAPGGGVHAGPRRRWSRRC